MDFDKLKRPAGWAKFCLRTVGDVVEWCRGERHKLRNKRMTAILTLRESKAERLGGGFAPRSRIETDEEMPQELYDRYCRDCRNYPNCPVCYDCRDLIEGQKQQGVPDDEILTMAQVVAICKEARAEIYAEEQAHANNR